MTTDTQLPGYLVSAVVALAESLEKLVDLVLVSAYHDDLRIVLVRMLELTLARLAPASDSERRR